MAKTTEPQKDSLLSRVTRFGPAQFKRITEEMYRQNLELAEVNKTLSLLRTVDVIVLEPGLSLHNVSQKIAEAIVEEYDSCAFAALYYRLAPSAQTETLLAWAYKKSGEPLASHANPVIDGFKIKSDSFHDRSQTFFVEYEVTPLHTIVGVKKHQLEELVSEYHIKELYVAKLYNSTGAAGTLVMGLRTRENSEDKRLLGRIGEAVRIALDNKSLQEENQSILLKLQRSNDKLKMLDASKDEFISMASHQLRTPLTSVKGYLSMALDGDAGPITDEQRRILEEAFASSQRMVYLIGDFLNVSRLQTGKFELERSPVVLSSIIQDEIDQLRATAEARNVTLEYQPPSRFPSLMVDENKIRQVMMNFIDNAIYYAKPGGGRVSIELARHPHHISFRVRDNGIGVPATESRNLFTKFYRASNARKARPDGTGIGLFMAKKVILAHGGTLVFESKESEGSTFGFRLPTAKKQQSSAARPSSKPPAPRQRRPQ